VAYQRTNERETAPRVCGLILAVLAWFAVRWTQGRRPPVAPVAVADTVSAGFRAVQLYFASPGGDSLVAEPRELVEPSTLRDRVARWSRAGSRPRTRRGGGAARGTSVRSLTSMRTAAHRGSVALLRAGVPRRRGRRVPGCGFAGADARGEPGRREARAAGCGGEPLAALGGHVPLDRPIEARIFPELRRPEKNARHLRSATHRCFDSGLGGLTSVRELFRALPSSPWSIFGDTARVPYGNKSSATVIRFSLEIASFCEAEHQVPARGVQHLLLVRARDAGPAAPIPVLGVIEPSVRAAVAVSPAGRVGVVGTLGHVGSGAYAAAIFPRAAGASVISRACRCRAADRGGLERPPGDPRVAEEYLAELRAADLESLILDAPTIRSSRRCSRRSWGPRSGWWTPAPRRRARSAPAPPARPARGRRAEHHFTERRARTSRASRSRSWGASCRHDVVDQTTCRGSSAPGAPRSELTP